MLRSTCRRRATWVVTTVTLTGTPLSACRPRRRTRVEATGVRGTSTTDPVRSGRCTTAFIRRLLPVVAERSATRRTRVARAVPVEEWWRSRRDRWFWTGRSWHRVRVAIATNRPGLGGSVLIAVSGNVSGSGRIDASGGSSTGNSSGGREGAGGGGRVALYGGSFSGFDPGSQVLAQGGSTVYYGTTLGYGAAGTVLVFTDGISTYGDLMVDAGTDGTGAERVSPNTELPELGTGSVSALEVDGSDAWLTSAETLRLRWVGAWLVLEDGSGTDLGAFRVADIDSTGRALLSGAGSLAGAVSYRGEYRFDELWLRNGAGLVSSDRLDVGSVLAEGTSRLPSSTSVRGNVTVSSGAVISAATGDRVSLQAGGVFTVETGAAIDVSAQGYGGGDESHPDGYAPSGVQASSPDAGGSHGGAGFLYDGTGPVGEIYDSVYAPALAGGGGALRNLTDTGHESGAGGGVVEITTGVAGSGRGNSGEGGESAELRVGRCGGKRPDRCVGELRRDWSDRCVRWGYDRQLGPGP